MHCVMGELISHSFKTDYMPPNMGLSVKHDDDTWICWVMGDEV